MTRTGAFSVERGLTGWGLEENGRSGSGDDETQNKIIL